MTTRAAQLSRAVKAYDIRGRIGTDLDDDVVFAIGWATAHVMHREHGSSRVVIGCDMRPDSPRFAQMLAAGVEAAGSEAIRLGMTSTDQLYFASGHWNAPGLMVTASHNPADWNGIKICGPAAAGISRESGLDAIRLLALEAPEHPGEATEQTPAASGAAASELAAAFARRIRSLTGIEAIDRPLRIVADCGNGMAGKLLPEVFGTGAGLAATPIDVIGLYTELDGTFPNHEANPLDPANLRDVQAAVVGHDADLGLAFDGDADRCFFIDEHGEAVSASAIGALVAVREINRARVQRGEEIPVVLHNLITSRAVPEAITAVGGQAVRTPVGHSRIKQLMRQYDAVFACEHSAHYYFRDFYGADSGILAACHVIAAVAETAQPLSALVAEWNPYVASGEINSVVDDPEAALARIRQAAFEGVFGECQVDDLDGVMIEMPEAWCNVRPSNTEPLVRLNCETPVQERTDELVSTALELIRR